MAQEWGVVGVQVGVVKGLIDDEGCAEGGFESGWLDWTCDLHDVNDSSYTGDDARRYERKDCIF